MVFWRYIHSCINRLTVGGLSPLRPVCLGILATLLILFGCVIPEHIPHEFLDRVDRQIQFEELRRNPDPYKGKLVILGGEIIEVRNLENRTQIEILHKPLDPNDHPISRGLSLGRFLVQESGALDPRIFHGGTFVTLIGEVKGRITVVINGTENTYPLLQNRYIQGHSTLYSEWDTQFLITPNPF